MTLSAKLQQYSPGIHATNEGDSPAIDALCIIAGCSDERMRLLAESGRKSQFYYSPLFRKCLLRFHAARFPKVTARWKPKKKGRGVRRERMWLTPRSNRAFARFLHPETRRQKRIAGTEVRDLAESSSCSLFNTALWFCFFDHSMMRRLSYKCKQEESTKRASLVEKL